MKGHAAIGGIPYGHHILREEQPEGRSREETPSEDGPAFVPDAPCSIAKEDQEQRCRDEA